MKRHYEKELDDLRRYMLNNPLLKDFSWYMLSAFLPMALGFVKTPLFTRHFSPSEFGELGLVQITFSFLGMLLFSWIASCLWRYFPKYSKEKHLTVLNSNLLLLFALGAAVSFIIATLWMLNTDSPLLQKIIFYSFFYLIFSQLVQLYMVVVRLEGKSRFYTLFQSLRALGGLGLALFLVFILDKGIESLVSSLAAVECCFLLFLILKNPSGLTVSWKKVERPVLKSLITYGGVGLVLNMSMLAITYSDRYVILLYEGLEEVGKYDQVYKISQLSILALTTVFFNTINPGLLKVLEQGKEVSLTVCAKYMRLYVLWGLPIMVYLAMGSRELALILLGEEFRSAWVLMPYIFAGTLILGFVNFYELRMKFDNRFGKLLALGLSIAILNVLLNLIFISLYDYRWAAYTTLVSYVFLLVLAHVMEPEISSSFINQGAWLSKVLIMLSSQALLFYLIVNNYETGIFQRMSLVLIFVILYALLMRKELFGGTVNGGYL